MSFMRLLPKIYNNLTEKRHKPYISMTNRWRDISWFVRQGHVIPHIWDRIKWYGCPAFFVTPNYPCHIEVEASAACQMKCPMCAQGRMYERGLKMGNMDMEVFKKITDEIHRKVYSIKLSWRGEPTLNPHLHDMLRYAKKEKKMRNVAFLTNFERYDEEKIDDLLTTGIDYISISFDGMKETYEKIRYPAKFDETVAKIKYLRKRRDELGLSLPVIRVQSVYSAIKDDAEVFLALWEPIVDKVNFIADQLRSKTEEDLYDLDPEYVCSVPFNRLAIGWDGTVFRCYNDYSELTPFSNIKDVSVHEAWHSPEMRAIREDMMNGTRLDNQPVCRVCDNGAKATTGEWVKVQGRELPVRINAGLKQDAKTLDASNDPWRKKKRSDSADSAADITTKS